MDKPKIVVALDVIYDFLVMDLNTYLKDFGWDVEQLNLPYEPDVKRYIEALSIYYDNSTFDAKIIISAGIPGFSLINFIASTKNKSNVWGLVLIDPFVELENALSLKMSKIRKLLDLPIYIHKTPELYFKPSSISYISDLLNRVVKSCYRISVPVLIASIGLKELQHDNIMICFNSISSQHKRLLRYRASLQEVFSSSSIYMDISRWLSHTYAL